MSQKNRETTKGATKGAPGLALASSENSRQAIVLEKSGERVFPLLADDAEKASWVVKQLGQIANWANGRPDLSDAQTNSIARLFRALTYPRVVPGWTYDNSKPALFTGE